MLYERKEDVRCIVLHQSDNTAVLPEGGKAGLPASCLSGGVLIGDIGPGHKIAIRDVAEGERVIKYGFPIGVATRPIGRGEHIHVHNVRSDLGPEWNPSWSPATLPPLAASFRVPSFWGYRRPRPRLFGRGKESTPGIRNELWVIPTVGCVNEYLKFLAGGWSAPSWIENVRVLAHPYGCSQLGEDLERTTSILAGLARNPCAAGVVVAGLGCENLQRVFLETRLADQEKVRFLSLQEEDDDAGALYALLGELAEAAPRERELFPLSEVALGVKCGGSDGFSGLSANPLVGEIADRMSAWGGRILATEIPEMFGAEDVVASRISDRSVFEAFADTVRWFRNYYVEHKQPVYENPSPGNKDGGITTLEEKSLGAVNKCGSGPVTDVLSMGEQVKRPGVSIVFGPGNDLVSSTAMAAAGAQIILFTTGRGTPFSTVVPTIKISSNSRLFLRKPGWIDFDAGPLLAGTERGRLADYLTALLVETASGRRTRSEENRSGEIALFKDGVTL